jgi:hypothetical protein
MQRVRLTGTAEFSGRAAHAAGYDPALRGIAEARTRSPACGPIRTIVGPHGAIFKGH